MVVNGQKLLISPIVLKSNMWLGQYPGPTLEADWGDTVREYYAELRCGE
jgi:hypothetical protein